MLLWCRQSGFTALILAAIQGHIDVVKYLVEQKADLNAMLRNVSSDVNGAMLLVF